MSENKTKNNKQKKSQGENFHSKNIKHDPQAESARAKFGLNTITDDKKTNG